MRLRRRTRWQVEQVLPTVPYIGAYSVTCPLCGSLPGQPCLNRRGKQGGLNAYPHAERRMSAARA